MLVSSSEGFAREGLFAAILLMEAMVADCREVEDRIVREEELTEFHVWEKFGAKTKEVS